MTTQTRPFSVNAFELGPAENFIYLIQDHGSKKAAVVDPAWEMAKIIALSQHQYNLMFKFLSLDFYDHRIINWEDHINFYFHAKPLRTLMNEDLIIAKTFKSNLTPVCRFPKFVHF
jgi:hypothetical protein